MIIPHIDYREAFKNIEGGDIFCTECGDCYLVELSCEGDPILQCRNCKNIKIEDERN